MELDISEKIFDPSISIHRDVLLFCRLGEDQQRNDYSDSLYDFDFTDVGKWLIENHRPFVEEFANSKMPKSYRLHSKSTYIKARINELLDAEILRIKDTVKANKNDQNKNVYCLTSRGIYYAWLAFILTSIEDETQHRISSEEMKKRIDQLIDLMKQRLNKNNSSIVQFLLKFLDRCREGRLFIHLIKISQRFFFYDLDSIFISLMRTLSANKLRYSALFSIFTETITNLDNKTQILLLRLIKTDLEYGYVNNYTTQEWEQKRHDNSVNVLKLTLLCNCKKCNRTYPITMDIFEFLDLPNIFKYTKEKGPTIQYLDCNKCKNSNCLGIIPVWIDQFVGKNRIFYTKSE